MTVTVSKLADEPIMIAIYSEPLDAHEDIKAVVTQSVITARELAQPLYLIEDVRTIRLSFSDLVIALGAATRGDNNLRSKDVKIHTYVVYESNSLVQMAVKAANSVQYGISVYLAQTVEDALTQVREQVKFQAV